MKLARHHIALGVALLGTAFALVTGCTLMTQPGVTAAESTPVRVDPAALEKHVRMLSVTLHPRSVDNPANLQAAADYVHEQLRATGARTDVQTVKVDGIDYRNLIARFGPEDGPLIVIGAHYDSCADTPSYWRFDYPAVMITDTAFLRNPNYHRAGDTVDTLDYARMSQVVRAVHAVAKEF